MRTAYHEQLAAVTERLGDMCGLAGVAMERATQALLQADLVLAEHVIADHETDRGDARLRRQRRIHAFGAAGAGGR